MKPDIQAYIDAKFEILEQKIMNELTAVKIKANIDVASLDNVIENKVKKHIKDKK